MKGDVREWERTLKEKNEFEKRMRSMRKNTVIFDLDGTLLNTLEDLRDSVNVIMKRYGWETHSLEQIRSFVGNGIGKLMERSVPGGRENGQFKEAFLAFCEYYTGHCQIKTRPYDGVLDLMRELADNGFRLAIVSNKNDAAVKELNEIYFSKYTKAAIGDRKGARRKPAPDSVYAALEELGSKKEEAVYIGDSEVDYETAKNSGMDCILVSWGFRDREVLKNFEGAVVVDRCEEILELLPCGKMRIERYDTLPAEAREIRQTVFVEEQGFHEEFDGIDSEAWHLVLYDGDVPAATCRFFQDGPDGDYVVGRIAVVRQYRGQNIGSRILKRAEQEIRKLGGKKVRLHAQVQAKPFYEKQGYTAYGGVDYEENCPHVHMMKRWGCCREPDIVDKNTMG